MRLRQRPGGSLVLAVHLTLLPGRDDDLIAAISIVPSGFLAGVRGYADGRFEKDNRYEEFIACKFLAIDEFDKPRMTEFAQEGVFELIDDRCRWGMQTGARQRFTTIAMNVPPDTLPAYLFSRMRWGVEAEGGFRIVHNTDDDCRRVGL